jgi:hypothetical protein
VRRCKPSQLSVKPRTTSATMKSLLIILVVLTTFLPSISNANSSLCPTEPRCRCKWSGGKRSADCSSSGLTSIPDTLSSDTQVIIMDSNHLETLDKDVFKSAGLLNLQKISLRSCHLIGMYISISMLSTLTTELSGRWHSSQSTNKNLKAQISPTSLRLLKGF